jgi:hypothetical protein
MVSVAAVRKPSSGNQGSQPPYAPFIRSPPVSLPYPQRRCGAPEHRTALAIVAHMALCDPILGAGLPSQFHTTSTWCGRPAHWVRAAPGKRSSQRGRARGAPTCLDDARSKGARAAERATGPCLEGLSARAGRRRMMASHIPPVLAICSRVARRSTDVGCFRRYIGVAACSATSSAARRSTSAAGNKPPESTRP